MIKVIVVLAWLAYAGLTLGISQLTEELGVRWVLWGCLNAVVVLFYLVAIGLAHT